MAAIEDAQLAALHRAEAIADMARQAALTAGAGWHCPPVRANGEAREASDDEMSEASPGEVEARQAHLDKTAEAFLQAENTGVTNAEGEMLFSDQTWRPAGYDASITPPVAVV